MTKLIERTTEIEITSFNDLNTFAKMVANSDLLPKDFKGKPENIILAVMMGKELGLKPMQAIQNIAVINGRPAVWGDAILAIIMTHKDFRGIKEWDENDTAYCEIKREGREPHTESFSMVDAKQAGLSNKSGPWTQYPKRMRKARARAFCARDVFADALKGMRIVEEAQDIPEEKDVTPAASINELVKLNDRVNPVGNSPVFEKETAEKEDFSIENKEVDSNIAEQEVNEADFKEVPAIKYGKIIELMNKAKDQKTLMDIMKKAVSLEDALSAQEIAECSSLFNKRSQFLKNPVKQEDVHADFIDEMDNTKPL